jgi:isoquinoline 1-oxidoreductase beta subunit
MDGNAPITRRQFIVTAATAAGGLAIGLATGPSAFGATAGAQPWSSGNGHNLHDLDAFIAIEPDDSVLIRYVRSEMGQGSMTALP